MILTSNDGTLTQAEIDAIKAQTSVKNVVIVGGTDVVKNIVKDELGSGYNFTRLDGYTRYETSQKIVEYELENGMTISNVAIATGSNFPDALAGVALCGKSNSVLLLMSDSSHDTSLLANDFSSIKDGYFLGGTAAVSSAVEDAVKAATK